MRYAFIAVIAAFCFAVMPHQAQAARHVKAKADKAVQAARENLVLMPLHVSEDTRDMQGQMEAAIIQGLAQKYEIFSGERVLQELKKAASKENARAKKDCDETRCLEDVAIALQTENFAMVNVSKTAGGYLLSLSIKNVMTNKAVFDNSIPCKKCDVFDVVEKLKELSGTTLPSASKTVAASALEESQIQINSSDPESALWGEVQKGNSEEDYQAYLGQYPKGKFIALAKARLARLKEEARVAEEQNDSKAWSVAQQGARIESYAAYLTDHPKGLFATLAQARIEKLKKEQAADEARRQRELAEVEDKRRREYAEADARRKADESRRFADSRTYGGGNASMPALAKKNNCTACHAIDKKVVGPAWVDVSRKYRGDAGAEARLIIKVSKGGAGSWGAMPMPANDPAGVKQPEMRELVQFILGLAR